MLTLKQLEEWFNDIERIVFDLHVSVRNLKRLSTPADGYEEAVLKDGFFEHLFRMLSFTTVVQLCKLYVNKDTERRNFRKLFNRLKYEPYDTPLKKRLRQNRESGGAFVYKADVIRSVDRLIPELDARSELILRIKTLRDRLYAHTDPGKPLPAVSHEELEELTLLAATLLNGLRHGLFGHTFLFNENEGWRSDKVIEALAAGYRSKRS